MFMVIEKRIRHFLPLPLLKWTLPNDDKGPT